MSDLVLILYLSDISETLKTFLGGGLFLAVCGIIGIWFAYACAYDYWIDKTVKTAKKATWIISAGCVLAVIAEILIPSKAVFYAYAASNIADNTAARIVEDPRFEKIINLLDLKIDELLNEEKGVKRDKDRDPE